MDAIKFIQEDVARGTQSKRAIAFFLAVAIFAFPAAWGIGSRADLKGVFEPRVLIPNLLAAVLLGLAALVYSRWGTSRAIAYRISVMSIGAALLFAVARVVESKFGFGGVPPPFSVEIQDPRFFGAAGACFGKGLLATLITGVGLTVFAFSFSAWPSRRWRLLISALAGVSGSVMLAFHCDSPALGHVLLGHVGQAIVAGAGIFLLQEAIFRVSLGRSFAGVRDPGKLG